MYYSKFFVREPWGWGATINFDNYFMAEKFCLKYHISLDKIEKE